MTEEDRLEQRKIAVTKLELNFDKFITTKKREMLADPIKTRFQVERVRKEFLLNQNTIDMFAAMDMAQEYTGILRKFNKLLDGDLT